MKTWRLLVLAGVAVVLVTAVEGWARGPHSSDRDCPYMGQAAGGGACPLGFGAGRAEVGTARDRVAGPGQADRPAQMEGQRQRRRDGSGQGDGPKRIRRRDGSCQAESVSTRSQKRGGDRRRDGSCQTAVRSRKRGGERDRDGSCRLS